MIDFSDLDDDAPYRFRLLAMEWHSGQWSAFYAFGSSGIVEHKWMLLAEIEESLKIVEVNDMSDYDKEDLLEFKEWAEKNIPEDKDEED